MSKILTFLIKVIFSFSLLCGLTQIGNAQLYPNLKKYTAESGLPSSHVYQVIEDQKGFIWIATDRGLAKYDGYSFKYFTAKDGLPSDDVFKISEDNKGRLWLSTFNEIGYIFNDKYSSLAVPEGVSTNGILLHHIYKNGEREGHFVEISKRKQWLKIDEEKVSLVGITHSFEETYDTLALRNIMYLGQDKNHTDCFIHFSYGNKCIMISYLDDSDKFDYRCTLNTHNPNYARQIKSIFFPSMNQLLLVSGDDIYDFNGEKLDRLDLNIKSFEVHKANESEIIISEDQSYIFDIVSNSMQETKLPTNENFTSIITDKNNNLWASSFKGVYLLPSSYRHIEQVAINTHMNSASITAIFEDRKGRIWFGTKDQRLFYKNQAGNYIEVTINIDKKDFSKPKEIFSISENPIDGIVVSGNFGITNISEQEIKAGIAKRKRVKDVKKPFAADNLKLFHPLVVKNSFSQNKTVYLGTSRGFLSFSDKSPLSILRDGKVIEDNRVYAISAIKNNVYEGKKSGLYKVNSKGVQFLNFSQPISVLEPDDKGNLWIGTEGSGLSILKNDKIYSFPETEGKTIKTIELVDDNNVWILTNTDILRVKLSEKNEFKYSLSYSSLAEDLRIKSINKFLISKEKLYLCTNTGLQVLDTNLFTWETKGRKLFFTDLQINGESTEIKETYELSYKENCIEINYVSIEFNKPKEVNYEYKMEGLDTMWRSSNSLKQEFWFLQPGTYTFHIRAGLNKQNISETKKITFNIKAPWWKTPMAWLLFTFIFILTVISIATERSKRIIRKAKEKAKIEEQISDMRLQALQSQMNPHFIFNSLQAIQDYIFDKNEEQANKYLIKFSRLMRLILESSRKKFILLSEELKLIELYVSLEQLRFSEQFSYELSISDNIDQESLLVPSMLIQPFIENAVNHGLFHKKDGHGLLKLSIIQTGNYLNIIVSDNGIGLKAAQEIKEKMNRKEASRALEIVRERTSLYNKKMEEDIDLKIENRLNSKREVIGTIVTLKLVLPENQNSKN